MIGLNISSIPPQCPWHDMLQNYGAPNVHWCEELVCGYFNNPANTFSNLGYILIALYLLIKGIKLTGHDIYKQTFHKYFALSLLLTGLASGFYHATNNYLTQFFDFFGMFLLCSSLICANFSRLKESKFPKIMFWAISILFSSGFFYIHHIFPVQFLIVICIGLILIFEFLIYKKNSKGSYINFWLALFFMAMAQTFSQLDLQRIWCDPTDHIFQGHAIWHLLCAIGLSLYYRHINKS